MQTVLIADHHELFRLGLKTAFTGVKIIEAGDADEAFKLVKKHKPDLAVLNVRMPGDGLTCLNRIKLDFSTTPVVMLCGSDNVTYAARSVALGAAGFVMKDGKARDIINQLRTALAGEPLWSKEQLRRTSGAMLLKKNGSGVNLTKRESEVLKQLAFGLTNKEVAQVLGISYETVKEHVQHILRKLGVSDRTQAAVYAVTHQLV